MERARKEAGRTTERTRVNQSLVLNQGKVVEYRIRTSQRARSVRLTISPRAGLTVVAPLGFDLRRVPGIVENKRTWIEAHLLRFAEGAVDAEAAGKTGRRKTDALPETLDLPALGESWRIEYRPTNTRIVGAHIDRPGGIAVYGAVHDRDACRDALKGWLRLRTREEIVPWLTRLAGQNGFKFNEALIRGPKTRWASCSPKGTISLSFKLLFLERDWVRCVLLHELCHTVCMNHSPRFWALLGGLEPECKTIHKRMRDGWKRVPAWLEEN
ncbi:MAG: M48 family metallopeptidase [Deltaproteobacteria bacterium]|nr:M48 family metallopeptidase [Deltaproteobacteria bacterium]